MPTTNTKTKAANGKLSASAEALQSHTNGGFLGTAYAGLSKTRNNASNATIDCSTSKANARDYAQLTPRMHATLSELAKAYGDKPFRARGIDRGQAAIFIASGFILRHGKSGDVTDNVYRDAATPLQLRLSAETLKRYA